MSRDAYIRVLQALAARRKLDDLTIGPVLTWTTKAMLGKLDWLFLLPGVFESYVVCVQITLLSSLPFPVLAYVAHCFCFGRPFIQNFSFCVTGALWWA